MNFVEEQGSLPDPQQHKVHPLDLPEARKEYLTGWWLGVLATPQLFIALAAVLLPISNNLITPILAPLTTVSIAGFVGMQFIRRSWDFIPRKRQDTDRVLTRITLATEAVKALALFAGLVLFLFWAAGTGVPSDVVTYSIGAGLVILAIMTIDLAVKFRQRDSAGFELLCRSFGIVAVAVAIWIAFVELSRPVKEINLPVLVMGGAVVLAVWLLYSGWHSRHLKAERAAEAAG